MKNHFLKPALACLSLAAVMALATGCGPSSQLGKADTDALDVTIDTTGATITFWDSFGTVIHSKMEPIIAEFSQKTGINVVYESKSGYSTIRDAINNSATVGGYPNVANGYPDHFASYIKSDILLRLDGLIGNDHKRKNYTSNGTDFGSDGIMVLDYDDFDTRYTKENEMLEFRSDGTPYILGLPFNKSTEVMVYNSALFDWAKNNDTLVKSKTGGVSISVPETWADLKTVGIAINTLLEPGFATAAGGGADGKILGSDGQWYTTTADLETAEKTLVMNLTGVKKSDFRPFSYDSGANMFITLVRQYGGTYTEVDKSVTGKGYATFNNAAAVEAMTMVKDLFDSNILAIPATYGETSYCSNPFKAWKSVMNISSSGGLSNITSSAIPTGCAHVPYKSADKKCVISQGTSIGLFNKGTDKEKVAAWKLMVYLSQQANGTFTSQTGYFPTCDYALDSDDYYNYLNNRFKSDADKLQQASAKIDSEVYTSWDKFTDPGFSGSSDIRDEVEKIPGYLYTNFAAQPTWHNVQDMLNGVMDVLQDYKKND